MSDYEGLRDESQQRLVDFLNVELKLGVALVESALTAYDAKYMDHYAEAKANATKVAETVRRFMGQVEDMSSRTKIGKQLAELDRLISTL